MTTEEQLAQIHADLEQFIGLLHRSSASPRCGTGRGGSDPGPHRGRRSLGLVALPARRRRDGGAYLLCHLTDKRAGDVASNARSRPGS